MSTTAGEVGERTRRGGLQFAGEEEVVRAAAADHDPRAGTIDVLIALQGRGIAHQVRTFDDDVRRGVLHVGRAYRIDGDEGEVDLLAP